MDKIKKPISIAATILMLLSAAIGIWYFYAIGKGGEYLDMATNFFLRYFYTLFFIAVASVVIFSVANLFLSVQAAKRSLAMIAGFGILVFIAYLFSSNDIPKFMGSDKFFSYPQVKTEVYNQSLAKGLSPVDAEAEAVKAEIEKGKAFSGTVDTSLKTLYIVMLCAALAIVVTEIQGALKNL